MFPNVNTLTGIVQEFMPDKAYRGLQLFTPKRAAGKEYTFDIINRNKGMSKFRDPDGPAGVVKTTGKTRITALLHTMRDKKSLVESLIRWEESAGKHEAEALQAILVRELEDLNDMQDRRLNKLAYDLLTTGQMDIDEEGVVSNYNFGMTGTSTAGDLWNVAADATPISDIIAAKKWIRINWGVEPTKIKMTTEELQMIMASAEGQALLSDGTKDQFAVNGIIPKISNLALDIDDSGYDDNGTFKPHLSSDGTKFNKVLVMADGPVGDLVSTHPVDTKAPPGIYGRFAKHFETEDPAVRWLLQTQTTLPGLTMPNKVYSLTTY